MTVAQHVSTSKADAGGKVEKRTHLGYVPRSAPEGSINRQDGRRDGWFNAVTPEWFLRHKRYGRNKDSE